MKKQLLLGLALVVSGGLQATLDNSVLKELNNELSQQQSNLKQIRNLMRGKTSGNRPLFMTHFEQVDDILEGNGEVVLSKVLSGKISSKEELNDYIKYVKDNYRDEEFSNLFRVDLAITELTGVTNNANYLGLDDESNKKVANLAKGLLTYFKKLDNLLK